MILLAFNSHRESALQLGSVTNSTNSQIHLGHVVKQQHIISNEIKEAHSHGFRLHLQYFFSFFYYFFNVNVCFYSHLLPPPLLYFFFYSSDFRSHLYHKLLCFRIPSTFAQLLNGGGIHPYHTIPCIDRCRV